MFGNVSLLHLLLALGVSIGIFIFLLSLLLPGKEEKSKKSEKLGKVSYPGRAGYPSVSGRGEERPLVSEMDRNAIFATLTVIGEKIDELNKKIDGHNEEIRKITGANLEREKKNELNLVKLVEGIGKIEMATNRLNAVGSGVDKEIFNKLTEKISNLEEKLREPAVEKTEISEIKDKLNEVVTILKTLGS